MNIFLKISSEIVVGICVVCILPILLIAQEAVVPDELLSRFRDKDNQFLGESGLPQQTNKGFEVSFTMKAENVFDPNQGTETTKYEMAWTPNWHVVKGIHDYEHSPVYRPPDQSIYLRGRDYDENSNLIIWRTLETYIFSTKGQNEKVEQLMSYTIRPDGEIKSTYPYTIHSLYPVGSLPKIFAHFQLATGRGFTQYFTRLASQRAAVLPSQLRRVDIEGGYRSGFVGKWTITYDQEKDFLIREGTFTIAGREMPLVTINNTGLVTCPGLSIAQSGVYTHGKDYRAEFQVKSLKSFHSSQPEKHPLYTEVLERITAPLPRGSSTTIDHRTKPPKVIQ